MAKVTLGQKREIEGGYHIYRQPSQAGDLITVRRKVAMPSDVQHSSSKPTQRHRQIFSRASKRWAAIPAPVRADLQHNYGYVPVQGHPAAVDYKVLKGRELFLSQEMHGLEYLDTHLELPLYLCFILTDECNTTLDLQAHLMTGDYAHWEECRGYYLCPGNTLFYPVPREEPLYLLGYATAGYFGKQIFTYYYSDILKLRRQTVMPYIGCQLSGRDKDSYWPPSGGFEPLPSPGAPYLWQYNIHQRNLETAGEFLPQTAFQLLWRKILPNVFSLTITLDYLVRNDKIWLGHYPWFPLIWEITNEGTGIYHTNPPLHTCVYHVDPWGILHYE